MMWLMFLFWNQSILHQHQAMPTSAPQLLHSLTTAPQREKRTLMTLNRLSFYSSLQQELRMMESSRLWNEDVGWGELQESEGGDPQLDGDIKSGRWRRKRFPMSEEAVLLSRADLHMNLCENRMCCSGHRCRWTDFRPGNQGNQGDLRFWMSLFGIFKLILHLEENSDFVPVWLMAAHEESAVHLQLKPLYINSHYFF